MKQKIQSMLEHIAVGDALGKVCSKYTRQEIISVYGGEVTDLTVPKRRSSSRLWYKGAITDDTILTLLVADSLIDNRGFNRQDIARRLIKVDPRGGNQINKLKAADDLDYVSTDGETNGGAIRVLPLAVTCAEDELAHYIRELSTLTHGSKEAIAGALLTAFSQYAAFHRIDQPFEYLMHTMEKYHPESQETRTWNNLTEAILIASETREDLLVDALEENIGLEKWSWSSIPTAIVAGFSAIDNHGTIVELIHRKNPGGDLDTVASIAGSIMGVRHDENMSAMADYIGDIHGFSFADYAKGLQEVSDESRGL